MCAWLSLSQFTGIILLNSYPWGVGKGHEIIYHQVGQLRKLRL